MALWAAAVWSGPATAEDIVAVYSAYWAGLPAAEIRLKLEDRSDGYHSEIEISTQGLPQLLTRFRATASAEGGLAVGRSAEPSQYVAVYDLRKRRNSRVSMYFAHRVGGAVAERAPDDTSRKPPLAEAFRKNAVDPLTALERIREALRSRKPGLFTIPVYDGARRFDIVGRILADKTSDDVLRAELMLRPEAGFKGETSEDGDPDDAPRKVELTATNDARAVPLSITVPVFFMPLVIEFQRLCAAADPCSG
ncbi:MAG: DUF3108 domain-containing protein [Stellaceae bacterium]